MDKSKRNSAGSILLEVLVAFVVLTLGLLALARFHYGALSVSADAKARTEALNYSQKKIEESRNISSVIDYNNTIVNASDSYAATEAFSRALTVNPTTDYKDLSLVTSWKDSRALDRVVALRSFVHREEPLNAGTIIKELNATTLTNCSCNNSGGTITVAGGEPAPCTNQCCQLNVGNEVVANNISSFTAQCFTLD